MKKILSSAAVFTATAVLLSASAFASCPLKQNNACKIEGNLTGAAAPVSYIVAPVQNRTYVPPCNTCGAKKTDKNVFQKIMTPFTGMYNAVFSPFTMLYD